ncbi:extensin [Streptomyces sp. NPDC018610]|uniref:extensin n=1 Tax=Streptomyces sp. NPDC018610 TaxID=3365049 RepID=UPI00379C5135
MADEQYRWLDRDTAERLLRGESPDTVDATARHQAERLARALNALAAEPYGEDRAEASRDAGGLPGEAAALAAFRKAAAERADARTARLDPYPASAPADAGVVRIQARPRPGAAGRVRRLGWGRPVHLALSAALAAGAVGGVAAAATTGVLPTPFGGDDPAPAASVSARPTPGRPAATLSSGGRQGDGRGTPTPGGTTAGAFGGGRDDTARDGAAAPGGVPAAGTEGDGRDGGPGGRRGRLTLSCRDLRDGKGLDALRRRALDGAAGGAARVGTYCDGILKALESRGSGRGGDGGQGADGGGDRDGRGGGRGGHGGDKDGKGGKGDDDGHPRGGLPGGGPPRTDIVPAPSLGLPLPKRATVTPPATPQAAPPATPQAAPPVTPPATPSAPDPDPADGAP